MPTRLGNLVRSLCLIAALLAVPTADAFAAASWSGVLRDAAGKPIGEATVRLRSKSGDHDYTARTSANGNFAFTGIAATDYELSVEASGNTWHAANPVTIKDEEHAHHQSAGLHSTAGTAPSARQGSNLCTGQRRRAPFQRRSFQPAPECARLQQVAAAGGGHHDRRQRRR